LEGEMVLKFEELYVTDWPADLPLPLFTQDELEWLRTINI
jgi:hypothetical protein